MAGFRGTIRMQLALAFGALLGLVIVLSAWGWVSIHRIDRLNALKNQITQKRVDWNEIQQA